MVAREASRPVELCRANGHTRSASVSAGKVALIVIGIFTALVSFALLVGGAGLLWAYGTQRDADGFFTTSTYDLATDEAAITTEDLGFGAEPGEWWPTGDVATLRLEATGSGPVFIGIGPSDEVDTYLADVGRAELRDIEPFDDTPDLLRSPGTLGADPPGSQPFWVASAEGEGTQTLTWDIEQGTWTAVLMNADGSDGVAADVVAGVRIGLVLGVAIAMLVGGVLIGLLAAALLIAGLRRKQPPGGEPPPSTGVVTVADVPGAGRPAPVTSGAASPTAVGAGGAAGGGTYPLRIEGVMDSGLSRWMWLVKWLLAIPHFILLAFLLIASFVTTVVAGFAILFTTTYPRGLFDFNVGVMRWTWRVSFYCASPVATDAYPPFTLAPVDYPATLDVAYPVRLNRWLPLVKWLLAIPQLIIVGLFTSGALWWFGDTGSPNGDAAFRGGGGLVQILSLIALIFLLFTARYPQGLFDLVMGMERWAYRTWAYVGLMTDDYPPFRLDMGGLEQAPPSPTPRPAGPAPDSATTS